MSRPMFHETGYGRKFFERQLPELIKSINRVADALEGEEKKEEKRVEDKKVFTCLNCGETTNSPNLYKDTMGDFIVCGNCGASSDIGGNLIEKAVYRITGEDVAAVLEDMGHSEIVNDEEEFRSLMNYLSHKLELPWYEYLEATIQLKLDTDKTINK